MLINLGEWRKQKLTPKLQALVRSLRRAYPDQLLSTRGTQRPLQLLFAGRYTRLPLLLNVQGCGLSHNLREAEMVNLRMIEMNRSIHHVEFEKMGGLLHYAGRHKYATLHDLNINALRSSLTTSPQPSSLLSLNC